MNQIAAPMPASSIESSDQEQEPGSARLPVTQKSQESKAAPASKPTPSVTRRRVPLWLAGLLIVSIAVAAYLYIPSLYVVETDDAYVEADTISIVPKVAAYVVALHVTDNSQFSAGELLVELDPRDFEVALESAKADLQSAEAQEVDAEAKLSEQNQIIAADAATVRGDQATLAFATQQVNRFGVLAKDEAGTVMQFQQSQSDIGSRQAGLQKDQAILDAAHTEVAILQSEVRQAEAEVAHAQAGLGQARLNLSYTKIHAEVAGTVANRNVQTGNFVQQGETLFSEVPKTVYIVANFKETQLTDMRVGQPVTVSVDAFPNIRLHGHVDSFQRGTGSYFALLPPENATGNFVKVVQRVPVKIILDETEQNKVLLAPGMSVEPSVTIDAPPAWLPTVLFYN